MILKGSLRCYTVFAVECAEGEPEHGLSRMGSPLGSSSEIKIFWRVEFRVMSVVLGLADLIGGSGLSDG